MVAKPTAPIAALDLTAALREASTALSSAGFPNLSARLSDLARAAEARGVGPHRGWEA